MRAAVFDRHGGPEVLVLRDTPVPEPGPGQVLIKVSHAGINFAEVMFRRGQIPVGLPHVPGLEAVGSVVRVGSGVDGLAGGDRVAALTLAGGGQAEYAVAEARFLVPLTDELADLDSAVAAAVLCNGTTAVGAITLCGRPQPGDRILVTAAAGGVGGCLIDLLAAEGHAVIAATSDPDRLRAPTRRAAEGFVTYSRLGDIDPLDVVFDSVGGAARRALRAKLALLGRHVVLGDAAQEDVDVACDSVWFGGTALVGYNLGALAHGRPDLFRAHLRRALQAAHDGRLTVAPELVTPEELPSVHRQLENRTSRGKYVLTWGLQ